MTLRTHLLIGCTVVDLIAGFGAARAEFQLAAQTAPPTERAEAPGQDTAPARIPVRRISIPSGVTVATGFGHQVPLSFALRQVVPKGVTITTTDGVDPDAVLVDWTGGRPWPDVIRAVLRQLGLRATIKPGSVLIERASP